MALPTSRPAWPRRWGWPQPPGSPGARSRTSPATPTTPSTTPGWPRPGSRPPPRPPTGGPSTWCSPPGPRTTCTAVPTWPTPSPVSRPQEAGADVLYAPGLTDLDDIRRVVSSLDRPVNVLARPGVPAVAELAAVGVARISVGGGFAFAALGAVLEAAAELRDAGTYTYWERAATGAKGAAS